MLRAVNSDGNILRGCVVTGRLGAVVAPGPVFRVATPEDPVMTTATHAANGTNEQPGLSTATLNRSDTDSQGTDDAESLRDSVHSAFEHVALNFSCTLPMLLGETRKRGISDEDVREVIGEDEVHAAEMLNNTRRLQCFRSAAGVPFINRDTGVGGYWLASVNELFADMNNASSCNDVQPEPASTDEPGEFKEDDLSSDYDGSESDCVYMTAGEACTPVAAVSECFDAIAYCDVTTLPRLLAETRRGGITDSAVRDALLCMDFMHVDDRATIRIFRGADDSVYLQKSCGKVGQIASVREAFAELQETLKPEEAATAERHQQSGNNDGS